MEYKMSEEMRAKIKYSGDFLTDICHNASYDAGWWHAKHDDGTQGDVRNQLLRHPSGPMNLRIGKAFVAEKLMLIVSEVGEAMEGFRKNKTDEHLPHRKSVEVELADAIIRIADLAGALQLSPKRWPSTPSAPITKPKPGLPKAARHFNQGEIMPFEEAKPNPLTDVWERFRTEALRNTSPQIQEKLRGVFYAGAISVVDALARAASENADEKAGEALIVAIMEEGRRQATESLITRVGGMMGMTKEEMTAAMKGNPQ